MSTTLAATNLNRFVVFVAVVEMGSLTAAAARLGIAKTAVSTHMQRLEVVSWQRPDEQAAPICEAGGCMSGQRRHAREAP
jgi:hypothetical protein